MAKFKGLFGGHVGILRPGIPQPIEILEGGTLETDDRDEIRALRASPEIVEVKEQAKARKGD